MIKSLTAAFKIYMEPPDSHSEAGKFILPNKMSSNFTELFLGVQYAEKKMTTAEWSSTQEETHRKPHMRDKYLA